MLPASLEGIGLECVVSEADPRGGYFSEISTSHTPIKIGMKLTGEIQSVTQIGDVFEAKVAVTNSGNLTAGQGTEANVYLECLYGNAKEVYGVSDQILSTVDLSGLAPGKTMSDTLTLEIPASVFNYCGYDAVTLRLFSPEYEEIDESDQCFVCLDAPMGLTLGAGSARRMSVGEVFTPRLSYDLSPFRDQNTSVAYTSEDPSVAMVMNGQVFAVGTGTTTITATVLPYGTSTTMEVQVTDGGWSVMPSDDTAEEASVTVTATKELTDSAIAAQSDGTITVNLSAVGKKVTTAVIPAAQMDAMAGAVAAEGGAERVEIVLFDGIVKLDSDTVEKLAETDKDVSVTLKSSGSTTTVEVKAGDTNVDVDVKVALPAAGSGQVLVIVKPDGTEEIVKKSVVSGGTVYAEIPAGSTVKLADKAKAFGDVAAGVWYKDAVDFVSSHGLFQGTDKGFEPDLKMNRAMLATVLYRLEGAEATGKNPFADVADDAWYTDAVIWASGAGIVTGTGNGFEPDAPVTREQIAVMLYRYANYLGLDTGERTPLGGFNDGARTSPWATDAMQWAVSVGLFQGNADGSLNPGGDATRAEVATLLERMVKLIVV